MMQPIWVIMLSIICIVVGAIVGGIAGGIIGCAVTLNYFRQKAIVLINELDERI